MELNKKPQSFKQVLFKYLVSVGMSLVVAIGIALLIFTSFYNAGLIVPANYVENQLLENREIIAKTTEFEPSLLPKSTSYVFLSSEGRVLQSNMGDKLKHKAIDFHNHKTVSTAAISFMEIKRNDGYILVSYSLKPHYNNIWMEKHLPSVNYLLMSLIGVLCFASSLTMTFIWAKKLKKELKPMLDASKKIAEQDLDFEIKSSTIKEFNAVLDSIDKMKLALSDSLKENWLEEERKKEQLSSLMHDLKTPIAIVEGNASLLKETDLTDEQKDYVYFIIKSSSRISDYIKVLMTINTSNQISKLNLEKIKTSTIVRKTKEIAHEVTSSYKRKFSETIDIEDEYLLVDLALYERVIDNILVNAIENSPKNSPIEIQIRTTNTSLNVVVMDQGKGFSAEDLSHGTEQFYRGDKSRHSAKHYGLGLYSASQIIELHEGMLILENRDSIKGAKVSVLLPLINDNQHLNTKTF